MLSPVPIANVIFLSITDDDDPARARAPVSMSTRTFDLTIAILHHARGPRCRVPLSPR